MWIPRSIVEFLTKLRTEDLVDIQKENAALRAERDTLKFQLQVSQNQFDWIRHQVNSLQLERAALLEKAYSIKVPAPEIVRASQTSGKAKADFNFEDIGEDLAKQLGLPTYDS